MQVQLSKFLAEIKKVSSRKSASLDVVYQLVLETDDQTIMDLGKLPADALLKITVELAE